MFILNALFLAHNGCIVQFAHIVFIVLSVLADLWWMSRSSAADLCVQMRFRAGFAGRELWFGLCQAVVSSESCRSEHVLVFWACFLSVSLKLSNT